MTIRITSVPRPAAPNSGFHPMLFAERCGDTVWAIPGMGPYIGHYQDVRHVWCDFDRAVPLFTVQLMRVLALLAFFTRALFLERQVVLVHSFVFCIPLWAARQDYALIIHGSDWTYLNTRLGAFFARRAVGVYGVGFSMQGDGFEAVEIPNVFDLSTLDGTPEATDTLYEVLFVLRAAPVKNPTFPFALFENTSPCASIRIGVIGLAADFLTVDQAQTWAEAQSDTKRIDYLGRQPFAEVARLMKSSRVMILPSHSEGVAKAMLEALACGLHLIVSDRLRIPNSLLGHVIRVDLSNWKGLTDTISKCVAQGRNHQNVAFVKAYQERSAAQLEKLYRDLSAGKRRGPKVLSD